MAGDGKEEGWSPYEQAKRRPLWKSAQWLTFYAEKARKQEMAEADQEFLTRLAECGHMLSFDNRPFAIEAVEELLLVVVGKYGWTDHMLAGQG